MAAPVVEQQTGRSGLGSGWKKRGNPPRRDPSCRHTPRYDHAGRTLRGSTTADCRHIEIAFGGTDSKDELGIGGASATAGSLVRMGRDVRCYG